MTAADPPWPEWLLTLAAPPAVPLRDRAAIAQARKEAAERKAPVLAALESLRERWPALRVGGHQLITPQLVVCAPEDAAAALRQIPGVLSVEVAPVLVLLSLQDQ